MSPTLLILLLIASQVGPGTGDATLGEPIVDGTYGYSIRPPRNWQVVRQRRSEPRGFVLGSRDVSLVRMIEQGQSGRLHEISLRQATLPGPRDAKVAKRTLDDLLKDMRAALSLEFNDVRVASQQAQTVSGRPVGVLATTYKSEGVDTFFIQAAIDISPTVYYVLACNGPAAERTALEPVFHQVLASFKLLTDRLDKKKAQEAMSAAATWLKSITPESLAKSITPESYFLIELDGKPAGFVGVQQAAVTRKDMGRGIEVHERGWLFTDAGVARRHDQLLFVSENLERESWKNIIASLVPADKGRPQRLDVAEEEGIRTREALLSSQCYQTGMSPTANPALQLPPSYISRGIIRMFPRLIGELDRPRMLVFAHFDHGRAGLVFLIEELKGLTEPPENTPVRGNVYLIEEREGLAAEPSRIYVNEKGEVVLVKLGTMTMRRSALPELERQFTGRVKAAERTMEELKRLYEEEQERLERNLRPARP